MSDFLAPYLSVGIGTVIMPSVYFITSEDEFAYIAPGYYSKVNDPACRAMATVYSKPGGIFGAGKQKIVTPSRYAVYQDVIDRGLVDVSMYPTLASSGRTKRFLEGWIMNHGEYEVVAGTPQQMFDTLNKNLKCY